MGYKAETTEIRDEADDLLKKRFKEIFRNLKTKMSCRLDNHQDERGIDGFVEITDRASGDTLIKFNIQNKGIQYNKNLTILKNQPRKGLISFQLDGIRHVKLYLEGIWEPVIIFICDLETETVYWHPIQLDHTILKRSRKQIEKGKNSIQLYVNPANIFKPENSDQFISDVERSKKYQNVDYNDPDYYKLPSATFQLAKNNETLIANLHTALSTFGGFEVIPKHVLASIYPMSVNSTNKSYFHSNTLHTWNTELISELRVIDQEVRDGKANDLSNEAKEVLQILQINVVKSITDLNNPRNELYLATYPGGGCNCEWCSYKRLNFKSAIQIVKSRTRPDAANKLLRRALTAYNLGLYGLTIELYHDAYKLGEENKEWENCYIALYNVSKILRYIKRRITTKKHKSILLEFELMNIESLLKKMTSLSSVEQKNIYDWINNERYIHRATAKMYTSKQAIDKAYWSDQRGGWFSSNDYGKLYLEYAHLVSFVEKNHLATIDFPSFLNLTNVVFDGSLAIFSIKNKTSARVNSIDEYLVSKILLYGDHKQMIQSLNKYSVKDIKVHLNSSSTNSFLISATTNLFNSRSSVERRLKTKEGHIVSSTRRKIGLIISNALVLFGSCRYPVAEVNRFFKNLLELLERGQDFGLMDEPLDYFIKHRSEQLSTPLLKRYIKYFVEHPNAWWILKIDRIVGELERRDELDIVEPLLRTYVEASMHTDLNQTDFFDNSHKTGFLFRLLQKDLQTKYTDYANAYLDNQFNMHLYYRMVMLDIIDYEAQYNKFVQAVPIKEDEISSRYLFSAKNENEINERLNHLIAICYKKNLAIPETIKAPSVYYEWLFNPETFDYALFDPYWLLEYTIDAYIEKFAKIPQLVESVRQYLVDHHVEAISQIYLTCFVNPS